MNFKHFKDQIVLLVEFNNKDLNMNKNYKTILKGYKWISNIINHLKIHQKFTIKIKKIKAN
jgi:hypothetical protein